MFPALRRTLLRVIAAALPAVVCVLGLSATANAAPGIRNIGPGPSSNHAGVVCVQLALARTVDPGIAVDGLFGPQTYRDVKLFQRKYGLSVDGIVGPNTGDKIVAVDNAYGVRVNGRSCWSFVPTH